METYTACAFVFYFSRHILVHGKILELANDGGADTHQLNGIAGTNRAVRCQNQQDQNRDDPPNLYNSYRIWDRTAMFPKCFCFAMFRKNYPAASGSDHDHAHTNARHQTGKCTVQYLTGNFRAVSFGEIQIRYI